MRIERKAAKRTGNEITIAEQEKPGVMWSKIDRAIVVDMGDHKDVDDPGSSYSYDVFIKADTLARILEVIARDGLQDIPQEFHRLLRNRVRTLAKILSVASGCEPPTDMPTPPKT